MQQSESIADLAAALAAAQGELEPVKKGTENPFYKSKYADLDAIVTAVRPVLSKHGLAVAQFPESDDTGDYLTTQLMHASGQWLRARMRLVVAKQDAQGMGSGITYMRRYTYSPAVGVVTEADDDGTGATAPPAQIPRGGIPPAAEGASRVSTTPDGEIVEDFDTRRQRILAEAKARGPLEEKAEAVQAAQRRTRPSPLRT